MLWMSSAVLVVSLLMMTVGLLLMLDAGIHLARKLRTEDRR